jgi:hypothetical protein
MNFKVIITGATGMVGEGVLIEALAHPQITEVLSLSRKSSGLSHAKLKEYLISDFLLLPDHDEKLKGYDACFFCAGVSSVGMKELEYSKITFDITCHVAKVLLKQNKDMTFIYVSGAGTDSSEKGRSMWARVKGKTENTLTKMGFKNVYNFRPGIMKPTPGQKNILKIYRSLGWLFPIIQLLFPNSSSTMKQIGLAMINSLTYGYEKQIIEVKDLKILAAKADLRP